MKLIHKNTRDGSFFKGNWDLPEGTFNEYTVVTFENEECLLPKELFNEFFDLPERGYCKKENEPNKRKFKDKETSETYEVENPFVKYNYSRVISPTISEFKNHNTVDALDGGKSVKEFVLNPLPEEKDFEDNILGTRTITGPKYIINQLRDNNMETAKVLIDLSEYESLKKEIDELNRIISDGITNGNIILVTKKNSLNHNFGILELHGKTAKEYLQDEFKRLDKQYHELVKCCNKQDLNDELNTPTFFEKPKSKWFDFNL